MKARRVLLVSGACAVVAAGALAVMADDGGLGRDRPVPTLTREPLATTVAAGRSWRLELGGGPVHVWVPPDYHPDGAATILYVHGYYTDLDQAWTSHRLAEQFALSAINAVFIAPEAPSGSRQKIHWPSLADLLVDTFGATGLPRPMGPVIAIGHSGAYRTLFAWMDFPGLDLLVAMDAMYGEVETWRAWLDGSEQRRLIMVGDDTTRWTEELARDLREPLGDRLVTIDRFTELDRDLPPGLDDARLIYLRSQFGHMPLVTEGVALPQVLRLLPVPLLADGPWHQPPGLPPRGAGGTGRVRPR